MLLRKRDARSLKRWREALLRGEQVEAEAALFGKEAAPWAPLVDVLDGAPTFAEAPPGGAVTVVIPALRVPIGVEAWLRDPAVSQLLILANGTFPVWSHPDPRVRVQRVAWEGHGRTRQHSITQVTTEFVLFSVEDALPRGTPAGWLREGLGDFAAVSGRQLPWPDSDAESCRRLWAWTPPGEAPQPALPHPVGGQRHDHVLALYRTESLRRRPLPDVPIGEDWHWARQASVGYCPRAQVVHAHPREFWPLYLRTRDTHREFCKAGFPPTVPDFPSFLAGIPGNLGSDWRGGLGELLGQWVAGQQWATGRRL